MRVVIGPDTKTTQTFANPGRTFGILVPIPADFLDEWELDGSTSLGEPLTFITRENGREVLGNISADKIGQHIVRSARSSHEPHEPHDDRAPGGSHR